VQQQHHEVNGIHKAGGAAAAVPRWQAEGDADDDVAEVVDVAGVAPKPREKQFAADGSSSFHRNILDKGWYSSSVFSESNFMMMINALKP
jgi:hypothetical protein